MNETLELIKNRYSCRAFTDQAPTEEQLQAIAQAALQAPSGVNRQHWQVIVVKNRELIREIEAEGMDNLRKTDAEAYQRMLSRKSNIFYNAPCLIMTAVKPAVPKGAELIDLGILTENIVIAATSLGLASLHCGLAAFAFAGEKGTEFKEKLGFFEGYDCGYAVLLGHAAAVKAPHEPDPSKVTVIE